MFQHPNSPPQTMHHERPTAAQTPPGQSVHRLAIDAPLAPMAVPRCCACTGRAKDLAGISEELRQRSGTAPWSKHSQEAVF
jgi:hypothetical protein